MRSLLGWCLVLALSACFVRSPAPPLTGPVVGYTTRTFKSAGQLRVALFFPTVRPLLQQATHLGAWWVEAQGSEAVALGQHPLVLISHGHLGSRYGHHDLAVALARAGYVVAALEHPGDNYADPTGGATERVLLGRAWQVSAVIDALLEDPVFAPHLDESRIGVAGFSAGGLTSLLLVGAKPDFTRWTDYCARHPEDRELCQQPHPEITVPEDQPLKEDRIRGAFVMAPLAIFFAPGAFAQVRARVSLWVAEKDSVLLPAENADVVHAGLSSLDFTQVPDADHYVFLAPCPPELAASAPALCVDPPGVSRAAVHESLNTAAVKFFDQVLKASPRY
jgi:predicted dienelactone hydrolase